MNNIMLLSINYSIFEYPKKNNLGLFIDYIYIKFIFIYTYIYVEIKV